ncbi:MAG: hypothetical protein GC165_07150 [Armatimonadetes bacterium]|nr:hypothetical protein [Armatimonadota bacterium]
MVGMIDRFRHWYEHEKAANLRMIEMIESVPFERHEDPRFVRAVCLAAHLAACRENWLDRMDSDGENQTDWFVDHFELGGLRPRYQRIERQWTEYLERLKDEDLPKNFEFQGGDGTHYILRIETQLTQLVGHAFYHRGQVALLVDELGGETVDTDYLFWEVAKR